MSKYLVDTNIFIYASDENEMASSFFRDLFYDDSKDFLCSVVTEAELFSKKVAEEVTARLEILLAEAIIVDIDSEIARKAGEIRVKAQNAGFKVKLPDALIAATAIVENAILITNDTSDFAKINVFDNINIFNPMEP